MLDHRSGLAQRHAMACCMDASCRIASCLRAQGWRVELERQAQGSDRPGPARAQCAFARVRHSLDGPAVD